MIREHHRKSIENLAVHALNLLIETDVLNNAPLPNLPKTQSANTTSCQVEKHSHSSTADRVTGHSPNCQLASLQDETCSAGGAAGNVRLAVCRIMPFWIGHRECDVIFDRATGNAIVLFGSRQRIGDLIRKLGEKTVARALLNLEDQ